MILVLGKFGLVPSGAIFARLETGWSGPQQDFWDRDQDHQGPSISVWSGPSPESDLVQTWTGTFILYFL